MPEILAILSANQLLLAMVLNAGLVTLLVRRVTWFARLGDVGRVLTSLISSVAIISVARRAGLEPSAELLQQVPMLMAVLMEALATFAGGAVVFKIAKTQPPSAPVTP